MGHCEQHTTTSMTRHFPCFVLFRVRVRAYACVLACVRACVRVSVCVCMCVKASSMAQLCGWAQSTRSDLADADSKWKPDPRHSSHAGCASGSGQEAVSTVSF